jgi:hypothetical protein
MQSIAQLRAGSYYVGHYRITNVSLGGRQMSKQQSKRAHSVSNETNSLSLNIRRTAVSLAVAAALPGVIMLPSVAFAQDDS